MPTISEGYYAKWERAAAEHSGFLEKILLELIALNRNFENYHEEWKKEQEASRGVREKAEEAMKIVKEGRLTDTEINETFKKATKNLSPEEVQSMIKSAPELVKLGKRMMEEKDKEDAEWRQKLKGSK